MDIIFKNIHSEVHPTVVSRAQQRIERFGKIIDEGAFEAQVYVEINKANGSHHTGKIWRTSINLDIQGERFHAEAVQDTPERATDEAIRELQSELHKHRAKERSLKRKGGSLWKSLQQRFNGS